MLVMRSMSSVTDFGYFAGVFDLDGQKLLISRTDDEVNWV